MTAAVTTPTAAVLSDEKWRRVASIVEGKIGAFGANVANKLKAKLMGTEGVGEALTEEESKQTIALLKVAAQNAVGPATPLRASFNKSCPQPPSGDAAHRLAQAAPRDRRSYYERRDLNEKNIGKRRSL